MQKIIILLLLMVGLAACGSEKAEVSNTTTTQRTAPVGVEDSFHNDAPGLVGTTGKPQFVEFFTYWCPTCKAMKPTIHTLEAEYWGKIDFIYLDREDPANKDLVSRFEIRGQPVMFLLDAEGNIIQRWFGTTPAEELVTAFEGLLAQAGG